MKTKDRILTIPDYLYVLVVIRNKPGLSISELFEESKISYAHLHDIKKLLLTKEWAYIIKDDKKHRIHLTEKGLNIYESIINLLSSIEITIEQVYEYKRIAKNKKEVVQNESNEQ